MDRKAQVRAIIAARYPQLSPTEQAGILDLVWKEAQRDASDRMASARYPG